MSPTLGYDYRATADRVSEWRMRHKAANLTNQIARKNKDPDSKESENTGMVW